MIIYYPMNKNFSRSSMRQTKINKIIYVAPVVELEIKSLHYSTYS